MLRNRPLTERRLIDAVGVVLEGVGVGGLVDTGGRRGVLRAARGVGAVAVLAVRDDHHRDAGDAAAGLARGSAGSNGEIAQGAQGKRGLRRCWCG